MAFVLADNVSESSITVGTGDFELAGAITGYKAFGDVLADGDTTEYAIRGGTEWETGLGTYDADTNTLARTEVYESSNGDVAVDWPAGTKTVTITPLADSTLNRHRNLSELTDKAAARSNLLVKATPQIFTSGGHTAVAADRGNVLTFTTVAQTVPLTAAATLGSDWFVDVVAFDVAVTIDPNSTELVDGASTLIIPPGHSCRVWCTATAFRTNLVTSALMPVGEAKGDGWRVISGSPTEIDFTGLTAGDYVLKIDGVRPATDDSSLRMRVQTGGSTWQTTGYGYQAQILGSGGSYANYTATGDSHTASIGLTQIHGATVAVGSAAGEAACTEVKFNPGDTNIGRAFRFDGHWYRPDGSLIESRGTGQYGSNIAVTGIRLFWSPTTPVAFANVGRVGLFKYRG